MTRETENGLKPRADFDWSRVVWGGPHDRVSETCSYCGHELAEDDRDYVPLRLWSQTTGHAAVFCDACMKTYWGFDMFDAPDDGS